MTWLWYVGAGVSLLLITALFLSDLPAWLRWLGRDRAAEILAAHDKAERDAKALGARLPPRRDPVNTVRLLGHWDGTEEINGDGDVMPSLDMTRPWPGCADPPCGTRWDGNADRAVFQYCTEHQPRGRHLRVVGDDSPTEQFHAAEWTERIR